MVNRRRSVLALLLAWCAVAISACTGTPAAPDPGPTVDSTVAQFVAAWQSLKPDAIGALTTEPGTATQEVAALVKNLGPAKLAIKAGSPQATDTNTASATADFGWTLTAGQSWKYTATWNFTRSGPTQAWKAQWAPALINPKLGEGQRVALRTTDAADGSVLDRRNQQILAPTTIYSVVLLPEKAGDVTAAARSLADTLGKVDPSVTIASVLAGLKASKPATGYTVTNLRAAEYQTVRGRLDAIPGISIPSTTRNLPPTKDFAKILLSQAEPVAQKLAAGKPGWEIVSIDATGAELETLAAQPAKPGANVVLTIDTTIQKAAESVLARTPEPAMLVAIQPSTGEILAVAQNSAANVLGPLALKGQYPPGSTFKIVTATAGFDSNLITPTTQVDCPGVITVDNRDIHNYNSFDLGTVDVTRAFAKSCNTSFAQLATKMPVDALGRAAAQYGIGRDFVIPGITTLTGKVPAADSTVQKAENGFGQGVVLVTPFSAALMVATAATANMPTPTLIRGARTTIDQPAPLRSAKAQSGIRTLMRAVVTDGTASVLQDAGTVYAKTGTADFTGTDGVNRAHAWTVGFRGDVAFSVLIVAGNTSVRTTAIADAFLKAIPGS